MLIVLALILFRLGSAQPIKGNRNGGSLHRMETTRARRHSSVDLGEDVPEYLRDYGDGVVETCAWMDIIFHRIFRSFSRAAALSQCSFEDLINKKLASVSIPEFVVCIWWFLFVCLDLVLLSSFCFVRTSLIFFPSFPPFSPSPFLSLSTIRTLQGPVVVHNLNLGDHVPIVRGVKFLQWRDDRPMVCVILYAEWCAVLLCC